MNSVTCGYVICHLNLYKCKFYPRVTSVDRGVPVCFLRSLQWRQTCCQILQNYSRSLHEFPEKFVSVTSGFFVALLWLCSFFPICHCWRPITSTFGSFRNHSTAFGISLLLVLEAPDKDRKCVPSSYPMSPAKDRCCLHHVPTQMDVVDKATCDAQRLLSVTICQVRRLWADQVSCVVLIQMCCVNGGLKIQVVLSWHCYLCVALTITQCHSTGTRSWVSCCRGDASMVFISVSWDCAATADSVTICRPTDFGTCFRSMWHSCPVCFSQLCFELSSEQYVRLLEQPAELLRALQFWFHFMSLTSCVWILAVPHLPRLKILKIENFVPSWIF